MFDLIILYMCVSDCAHGFVTKVQDHRMKMQDHRMEIQDNTMKGLAILLARQGVVMVSVLRALSLSSVCQRRERAHRANISKGGDCTP
jgi:hypothetical protein